MPAGARYDLGCLYVGVNDVRGLDWDRAAFERGHRAALAFLAERCDRVLTMTVPLDLGRPRAGAKVHEVNAAIDGVGRATTARWCVDLRDFGARNLVMADHVHPTAFGQIAIAERALDGARRRRARRRACGPSALICYETTPLAAAARRPHVRVPPREGVGGAALIGARVAWDRRRAA